MASTAPTPDYFPEHIRRWADEHQPLLELVVADFVATGEWPAISDLTRRLARQGQATPLRDLFWSIPRPLGFVDYNPERIVLFLFALRVTEAGGPVLGAFNIVLRLAIERFESDEARAVVSRADLAHQWPDNDLFVQVVSDVLYREAQFLRAEQGGPGDDWVCTVDDSVVRYWNARTIDDYLGMRAGELRLNPQNGWGSGARLASVPDDDDDSEASVIEAIETEELSTSALDRVRGEREWVIGEPIGHGGFGQVFKARAGEDEAAIKFVPKDPGADRELLFVDLGDVPNVLPIIDSGDRDGFWFLVMPLAEMSLRDRLDQADAIDMAEVIKILIDIADALVALSERGVVHRDLKPENVLRLLGTWCLADFGISRYAEATTAADTQKYALSPRSRSSTSSTTTGGS